jgi:hypothetical protein
MKQLLYVCTFLLSIHYLQAQQALQSPEQYLGYPLGTQFTTHDKILEYIDYLCKQSPSRCKMQNYGATYEGRPLMVAFVSSEANMSRLEEIRTNNLKKAGLLTGQPARHTTSNCLAQLQCAWQ